MHNRRKFLLSGTAAAVVTAIGIAQGTYQFLNVRLSEEPVRSTGTIQITPRESSLSLRADVPLQLIRNAANQALPTDYSFGGNGPDVGGTINPGGWNVIKISVKAGTRYEGTVRRLGELKISGANNTVVLELPIGISGNGGFRGDGARLLGLNAKNFRAALNVRARVTVGVNPDWSPAVTIVPELEWTDGPKIEIADRAWVDIRSHVEAAMVKQLDAMADKIRAGIPIDFIKHQAEKVWKVYSLPISFPPAPDTWAHLAPVAIGTSGPIVENDELRLSLLLKARTEISTNATPSFSASGLPALTKTDAKPGELNLAVFVRADYKALRRFLLAEVGNKAFETTVAGETTAITIKNISIYSSGDRIAMGLVFKVHVGPSLFDVGGEVFLTGKPIVDQNGTTVRLVDVGFTRRLDNPLWSVASLIFEDQIRKAIEDRAVVDFSSEITKQASGINRGLTEASEKGGIKVSIRDINAKIGPIVPQESGIAALVLVDVGVDAELSTLPKING